MNLLFWLAAAGIVALAATWMMLAITVAGMLLRRSHQELVASTSIHHSSPVWMLGRILDVDMVIYHKTFI